jgi:hypothetical protein
MWEFLCKVVDSSGVAGVLIVLAFILVIIIMRQEKNLKANLVELNKEVLNNTSAALLSINESLIGIIKGLNELALLFATLSSEKSKREEDNDK